VSESAIYFVVIFTTLLLAAGVGLTFFAFRRGGSAQARVSGGDARADKTRGRARS